MNIITIIAISLTAVLSGCATIVNGDTISIPVSADEPGISVQANGQTYTTPSIIAMPRGQGDQTLVFRREDGEERTMTLKEVGSWWTLGNAPFMLLGIIFILVDASNPHGYTLNPDTVQMSFATGKLMDNPKTAQGPDGGHWDGP